MNDWEGAVFRLKLFLLGMLAIGLTSAGGCANSPWASQIQQSLAADPRLQSSTGSETEDPTLSSAASDSETPQLPVNFPAEIPRYPNAELVSVIGTEPASSDEVIDRRPIQTRWRTTDASQQVQQFYRDRFQAEGWQVADGSPLQASRDGLQVTLTAPSTDAPTGGNTDRNTEFSLEYQLTNVTGLGSPSPEASNAAASSTAGDVPQPGDPAFIGPVWPTDRVAQNSNPALGTSVGLSDLDQAPAELRPYINDLVKLGALPKDPQFRPAAEVTRRDYARWLVNANNLIYQNQPARKIRLAAATDQPIFQDVPATDPDFGVIQGLANAGLIPSPLSGDGNANFRPDAPLTREELILWKAPVDLRQALPNASIDLIQQTWGFQDGAKISPAAMRAVIADYQNGDLSNIRRAFGYTTLFQPQKTVSRAEAAAVLWQFGTSGNNLSAKDALQLGQSSSESDPMDSPSADSPSVDSPSADSPSPDQ